MRGPPSRKTEIVSVRLSTRQRKLITAAAARAGVTISSLIRSTVVEAARPRFAGTCGEPITHTPDSFRIGRDSDD